MHAPVPYSRPRPPVAVSPLIRDDVALSQIAAHDWNPLAGNLPLLSHEYFSALHRTRCAAPETGWTPRFLTAWDQAKLIGAMPLYAKTHSYGEYVFDWGWADAYRRYGRRYYPKLVAAIPFTPVPGPRLIGDDPTTRRALLERALGELKHGFSSLHVLFTDEDQAREGAAAGMLIRDATTSGGSPKATRSSRPTSASTRCGRRSTTITNDPRTLITSGGLGTMGFGLPAAIGAKMARPDAEVWAIVGDGGFQMTQAELSTAAQEGVKVNVAIINNGYLGHGAAVAGVLLRTPLRGDAAAQSRLREARRGAWPARPARREAARRRRRSSSGRAQAEGTVLIDFRVEQEDSVYPMVPAGADLDAMIRRPRAVGAGRDRGRSDLAIRRTATNSRTHGAWQSYVRRVRRPVSRKELYMHHTLVALVEDKPGVLNRVASLFRRRVFNIESLTVGRTAEPGISRMTIVIDSDQASAERVTAYLYKLVNVLQVEDLGSVPAVARDLALVKVAVAGHDRAAAAARRRRNPRAHRRHRRADDDARDHRRAAARRRRHRAARAARDHRDGPHRPGRDAPRRHGAVGSRSTVFLEVLCNGESGRRALARAIARPRASARPQGAFEQWRRCFTTRTRISI